MCMFTFNQILENLEKLDASCDLQLDNEINIVAFENGLDADEDRMEILEIIAEAKVASQNLILDQNLRVTEIRNRISGFKTKFPLKIKGLQLTGARRNATGALKRILRMDCARCEITTRKNALKRYRMAENANKFAILRFL